MIFRLKKFFQHVFNYLYFKSWKIGIWQPPDRKFIKEVIFPYFNSLGDCRRVLFVGVQSYTRNYENFFPRAKFETVDSDEKVAKYGASTHQTVDICEFDGGQYDLVFLNGVIGYGINTLMAVQKTSERIFKSLKIGGWLVLGTNSDTFTPEMLRAFGDKFEFAQFPPIDSNFLTCHLPFTKQKHDFWFFRSCHLNSLNTRSENV